MYPSDMSGNSRRLEDASFPSFESSLSSDSDAIATSLTQDPSDLELPSSDEEPYILPKMRSKPDFGVRSILKRPSIGPPPATPARSVTFSSSTAHPITPPSPPAPATYGADNSDPIFYRFDAETDQKQIIIDSPPMNDTDDNPLLASRDHFDFSAASPGQFAKSLRPPSSMTMQQSQNSFLFSSLFGERTDESNMLQASLPPSFDASAVDDETLQNDEPDQGEESQEVDDGDARGHRSLSITPARPPRVRYDSTTPKVSPPRFQELPLRVGWSPQANNDQQRPDSPASQTPPAETAGNDTSTNSTNASPSPKAPARPARSPSPMPTSLNPSRLPSPKNSTFSWSPKPTFSASSSDSQQALPSPRSTPLPPSPLASEHESSNLPDAKTPSPILSMSKSRRSAPPDTPESVYFSPRSAPRWSAKSTDKRRVFSSQIAPGRRTASDVGTPSPSPLSRQFPLTRDLAFPPHANAGSQLSDLQRQLYGSQEDLVLHAEQHKQLLLQIVEGLKADLLAKDRELDVVVQQRDEAQRGWDEAIDEVGEWEDKMEHVDRRELEQLRAEMKERERYTAQMEKDVATLQQALDQTMNEQDSKELNSLANLQVAALQEQLRAAQKHNDALQQQLEEVHSHSQDLQEQLRQQQQAHQRTEYLESENEELQALVSDLKERLDEARIDLSHAQDANATHAGTLDSHMTRISNLESSQDRLLSSVAELEAAVGFKDDQIRDLQARLESDTCPLCQDRSEHISTLQTKCDTLQKKINVMLFESSEHEVKISRLQKAKAELREDKEQLAIALDAKQLEIGMLKRRLQTRDSLSASTTTLPPTTQGAKKRASTTSALHLPNTTIDTPLPRSFSHREESTAKKQTTIARPRLLAFNKTDNVQTTPMMPKRGPFAWREVDKENTPPVLGEGPRRKMAVLE